MTPSPKVPEAAVEAAIATSSTWPMRDAWEKARYRERIERLLTAALPAIHQEIRERLLSDEAISAANRAAMPMRACLTAAIAAAFSDKQEGGEAP